MKFKQSEVSHKLLQSYHIDAIIIALKAYIDDQHAAIIWLDCVSKDDGKMSCV